MRSAYKSHIYRITHACMLDELITSLQLDYVEIKSLFIHHNVFIIYQSHCALT